MTTPGFKAHPEFSHVDNWVFDLDNTLYPAACDLFAEIDQRMTTFVQGLLKTHRDEARRIQKLYYAKYGTTLRGLMMEHNLTPDEFLSFVHDIDHTPLDRAPDLKQQLSALPGKKYIYTNGSICHAEKVTKYMGLDHLFDDMVCIAQSEFRPKHEPGAFERFAELTGSNPNASVMFEDLPRNLLPAHDLGFTTVLVTSDKDWSHEPAEARPAGSDEDKPDHVHHITDDLKGFLEEIAPKPDLR